ncbi:MAG: hypothetical protein ACTS3F_06290 [Phycisphaerales bacterium]
MDPHDDLDTDLQNRGAPPGVTPVRDPQPRPFTLLDAGLSEPANAHLRHEIRRRIGEALDQHGGRRGAVEAALQTKAMIAVERWHTLRFEAKVRRDRVLAARRELKRAWALLQSLRHDGDDPIVQEAVASVLGGQFAFDQLADEEQLAAAWNAIPDRLDAHEREVPGWFEEHRDECDAAVLCALHDAGKPARPLLPADDAKACDLVRAMRFMLEFAVGIDTGGVVSIAPEHLVGNRLDVLLRAPLDVAWLVARIDQTADLPTYTRRMFTEAVREQYRLEGRGKGGKGGDKPTDTTIRANLTNAGFGTQASKAAFSERDLRRIAENWSVNDKPTVELAVRKMIESRKGAGS